MSNDTLDNDGSVSELIDLMAPEPGDILAGKMIRKEHPNYSDTPQGKAEAAAAEEAKTKGTFEQRLEALKLAQVNYPDKSPTEQKKHAKTYLGFLLSSD